MSQAVRSGRAVPIRAALNISKVRICEMQRLPYPCRYKATCVCYLTEAEDERMGVKSN